MAASVADIIESAQYRLQAALSGDLSGIRGVLVGLSIEGALARAKGTPVLLVTPGGDDTTENYSGRALRQRDVHVLITLGVSDMDVSGALRTLRVVGDWQKEIIATITETPFSGLGGFDSLVYVGAGAPAAIFLPGDMGDDMEIWETTTLRFAGELHEVS